MLEPSGQMRLTNTLGVAKSSIQKPKTLSLGFSKTMLQANTLRSAPTRKFFEDVIDYGSIPNYRTVQSDIEEIVSEKVSRLEYVDFFSVQLDHWCTHDRQNVLIISTSIFCKNWKQLNQVYEFDYVPDTEAKTTSQKLSEALTANNISIDKCIAFQSNNCNSMIASHRLVNDIVSDKVDTSEIESFVHPNGVPFVGCGSHRLNTCNIDSVVNCRKLVV